MKKQFIFSVLLTSICCVFTFTQSAAQAVNTPRPAGLGSEDAAAVMKYFAEVASANKVEFCWRQSYGRGVGEPLSTCPNADKDGLLCYPLCKDNYNGVGPVCWQKCPSGMPDRGVTCEKVTYGRGAGYVLWKEDKCKKEHSDVGCEKAGALWYPKCKPGYKTTTVNFCATFCPPGYGAETVANCTKKSYGRTAGTPMSCKPEQEQGGALCYPKCKSRYHGVGPVCWQDCPSTQSNGCAAGCTKDKGTCVGETFNMVSSPIIVAVNILSFGSATVATSTARVGATTALKAAKLASGAAKAAEILEATKAVADFTIKYAADFKALVSNKAYQDVTGKFSAEQAEWLIKEYAKSQVDLILQHEFSPDDLRILASLDPTGIAGVAEAFAKPRCDNEVDFPAVKGR